MTSSHPNLKLQYVSDLHLEHYKIHKADQLNPTQWIQPDPTADALVLAGDIGWPEKSPYGLFLQWCSENWPAVFVIAGNHEFYTGGAATERYTYAEKLELLHRIAASLPNVHFLHRRRVELRPGVWILGATLWTGIPEDMRKYALEGLNDFRKIHGAELDGLTSFNEYKRWHEQDRDWLFQELEAVRAAGDAAIVVTHHLPTERLIHPAFADHPLNCCYATDLEREIERLQPLAWICGHSHKAMRAQIGRTQLALNPWGYPGERVETRTRQAVLEVAAPPPPAHL